jgi:hypothetical protein
MAYHYVVELSSIYAVEVDSETIRDAIEAVAADFLTAHPHDTIYDVRVWTTDGELVKDWNNTQVEVLEGEG